MQTRDLSMAPEFARLNSRGKLTWKYRVFHDYWNKAAASQVFSIDFILFLFQFIAGKQLTFWYIKANMAK